jgi:hypothetical protein
MPRFNVKTTGAEEVWKSPDGQRVIHKVTLDYNGSAVTAKTYSDAIATVGWSGEVESYEKAGRNGSETFVKQPPKEGGDYQGRSSGSQGGYKGASGGGKFEKDPFTMYLSYAKDIAVAMYQIGVVDKDGVLDEAKFTQTLNTVAKGGVLLFEQRADGEHSPKVETPDTVYEPTDEDITELGKLFPDSEALVEGEETPWTEPPQLPTS